MKSTNTPDTSSHVDSVDQEEAAIDRPGLHPETPNGRAHNETFQSVLGRNLARRSFLAGLTATVPALMAGSLMTSTRVEAGWATALDQKPGKSGSNLSFQAIQASTVDDVIVPQDYEYSVVMRWGDPINLFSPAFDPTAQTAAKQRQQFGYNCDFLGFFPLLGAQTQALLCVNHEYTSGEDMFASYTPGASKEVADIEIAAHGGSVIAIELKTVKGKSEWKPVLHSPFNRRITGETPMIVTGPAAGHPLLRTSADRTGRKVLGMFNNCAGGKTPWGTWLTCEENFNQYFANNSQVTDATIRAAHSRYGVSNGATGRRWENFYSRFNTVAEPNEPFRFGWVVEIDPQNPSFVPRKRTALGRMKHEGATIAIAKSGKVVAYTGDDQQFDYVYKFVSDGLYNERNRLANFDLLDKGTLYVAKLNDDGTGVWIPLTIENPVLQGKFADQGEILIKTRLAADAVGATAMDRPEDVEANPVTGKVYMAMTNNSSRTSIVADTGSALANPRVPNRNGHIIELIEDQGDHAATVFTWNVFLLCGDPSINLLTQTSQLTPGLPSSATYFGGYSDATKLGKIASPDNVAFDKAGNLWIATDGQPSSADIGRPNDAIHAVVTEGPERGYLRQFLSSPSGSEVCGPEFSDDGKTLFCAIQHPGEGGRVPNSISNWPDRKAYARPSVVAIRHKNGRPIGE